MEQEFIKGFNNGYLLAQYEPELLNKLLPDLKPGNNYVDGMLSGKEQHDIDKIRQPQKDVPSNNTPDKNKKDIEWER
ncbi:MAG: hypothetical protein ACTHMC_13945 [Pseudobacter sp.]|uniref:hypothetical protein n=1 Tax=Pseudobacter sp. TaxID=2045420 RepID=UPI003F80403E